MFSQDPRIQKTQMEALATDVASALAAASTTTLTQTTRPTQGDIQTSAATTEALPPEKRFLWYDGKYVRGEFGTIRDFLMPFTTSTKAFPANVSAIQQIFWFDRTRLAVNGDYYATGTAVTTTSATERFYLDGTLAADAGTPNWRILSVNPAYGSAVVWNGTVLYRYQLTGSGLTTMTNATVTATKPIACFDDAGNLYYISMAAPTLIKKRLVGVAGAVSTIATISDVQEMRWDETSQKLVLFIQAVPSPTSSVVTINADGTGQTTLVTGADYAGGSFLNSYHYVGYSVENGFLYVPVPGNRYLTTRRKYNITTGAYVDEAFDYGEAKAALEAASKEARSIVENSQGKMTSQRAWWGAEYLAYVFDRVVHAERSPSNDAYLLMYETGPLSPLPGASSGIAWAVLPDDGVSGKVYPLTEQIDPRGDFFIVKEYVYDVATKEMTLDWSDVDLTEFETIVITFDMGLTTATENIRIQLNGDTGSNYSISYWRNVITTVTNTEQSGTYWETYGVNSTTQLGGKYRMMFVDHRSRASVGMLLEGVASTAISSGTVSAIQATGKWVNPVALSAITSIRIFLSGATAFFAANASIQVMAYRTRSTYSTPNALGHE